MKELTIEKFADFISHGNSKVKNLLGGEVVRTFTKVGGDVRMICGDGTEITLSAEEPVAYEPWVLDRGSLLFDNNTKKACTELDVIEFENGETFSVVPACRAVSVRNK